MRASLEAANLQHMMSLDMPLGDESGSRMFGDTIPDSAYVDPGELIDREKIANTIRSSLGKLSTREEKILRLRFGIVDDLLSSETFNV